MKFVLNILFSFAISIAIVFSAFELSIIDKNRYLENGWEIFQHVKYGREIKMNLEKEELEHLEEVRGVIKLYNKILSLLFVFAIFSILIALNYSLDFKKMFLYSALLLTAIFILFHLYNANFEENFVKFHELLFTKQWRFGEESLLIKSFPKEFFVHIMQSFSLKIFIIAILLTFVALVFNLREGKK